MATRPFSSAIVPAVALAMTLGVGACNRSSNDHSMLNRNNEGNAVGTSGYESQDNSKNQSTPITVTGCVQETAGLLRSYVLSDVVEHGASPEQKLSYKLEDGKDLDKLVGKQVRVMGRLEGSKSTETTGPTARPTDNQSLKTDNQSLKDTRGTGSKTTSEDHELKVSDLAKIHVDSVERVADSCSSKSGSTKTKTGRAY